MSRCTLDGRFAQAEIEQNGTVRARLCFDHLTEWHRVLDLLGVLARLGGHTVVTTQRGQT